MDDEDDEDEYDFSLDELDELLREDIESEPQAFEPDAFDDVPTTFDEVAGDWYAIGDDEYIESEDDVVSAAHAALGRLRGLERSVIFLRFGFTDEGPQSVERIAERLDITERRVNQLMAGALRRMRGA